MTQFHKFDPVWDVQWPPMVWDGKLVFVNLQGREERCCWCLCACKIDWFWEVQICESWCVCHFRFSVKSGSDADLEGGPLFFPSVEFHRHLPPPLPLFGSLQRGGKCLWFEDLTRFGPIFFRAPSARISPLFLHFCLAAGAKNGISDCFSP